MNVPTKEQLNPISEDLDGKVVVENLLGKDIEGAVALLEENSLYYSEDYTWMGTEAFCYYAPALVRYLRSSASCGNVHFAYFMLYTFKHRLEYEGVRISLAFPAIESFCEVVEADSARLGFDEDYVRRSRPRIAEVRSKIAELKSVLDASKTASKAAIRRKPGHRRP